MSTVPDALDQVLRLVAEGLLSAEEAEPIVDALSEDPGARLEGTRFERAESGPTPRGPAGQTLRILVTENGRRILNLRVPLVLGRFAASRIPGLSDSTAERIRRAVELGITGPIVESLDPSGDGVRIVIE